MTHKTALVTGGTSGVGLSIVRELARRGVYVHFIGTNEERGKRIEQELNGAGSSVCEFIQLDLRDAAVDPRLTRRRRAPGGRMSSST